SFRRAVRDGPVLYEARTSAGRPAGIPLSPADQSNAHAPGGDDRDSGADGIISSTTSPTIPPASSAVSMVTSSRFRSANRFVTSNDPAPATGPSLSSFNRTSAGPTTRSKTSRTVSAGARLLGRPSLREKYPRPAKPAQPPSRSFPGTVMRPAGTSPCGLTAHGPRKRMRCADGSADIATPLARRLRGHRMRANGRQLRWGVLGVARICNRLKPAMLASKTVKLQAVASRSLDKARGMARDFGFESAYGSYEELLGDPKVDAVYVPLPNSLHAEWTRKAAEHGKHVLCEKPLCTTVAEAADLVTYCRAARVRLMDGFMWPHHPRTRRIRKM